MRKIVARSCLLAAFAVVGVLLAAPAGAATMVEGTPDLGSKVNTLADSLPGSDYKGLGGK